MEPSDPSRHPTKGEVEDRLVQLATGRATPEEVADWAQVWLKADDPRVDDPRIWDAIDTLAGADLKTGPSTYLHGESDFKSWLDEFRAELNDEDR